MSSPTLNKRVTRVYRAEQWTKARRLYEEGLSLEGVAEKLGIPYSSVHYHAWVEGWPVRSRGGQRDPRCQAAQAKRIRRKLEKEEKRLEQELVLVKTEDLELLARRSLAADNARAKVAVSRLVTKFISRLEDPSVPVRSAAQALGSLAPIFRLVWGWGDREADMQRMKRAVTSYADAEPAETPTGAVNLALIETTPEQLAQLAKGKFEEDDHSDDHSSDHFDGRDGDRDVDRDGDLCSLRDTARSDVYADHSGDHSSGRDVPSAIPQARDNGLSLGPSVGAPQQPSAATHPRPIPQKEAPPLPVNQPVQPRRENTGLPPPPLSPQERRRQELEELDRLRAEWRRGRP
jgi:hypothetical protein